MEHDRENKRPAESWLYTYAANLCASIQELWSTYQKIFETIDLEVPENRDAIFDILFDLEHNLIDTLDQVGGQIYLATGMFEPLPDDRVEDFEAAVLRTIGSLGEVDLEDYRVEYEEYDGEE